jgi:transcriptional regulator with XRE-family HTH domain
MESSILDLEVSGTGGRVATDRDIATWMRRQLDRREWSAADLARHIGMSPGRISEWLAGKRQPSSASCLRLADAFDADPDYVLALAGHRPATTPIPPDAELAELFAMLKRVRLTPDRLAGLKAQARAWLEIDRATPPNSAANGH